jgi:Sec-independent protein translocase protein TatA
MTTKNEAAAALGRMGRGVKKTMSAAAVKARQENGKKPKTKRKNDNGTKANQDS